MSKAKEQRDDAGERVVETAIEVKELLYAGWSVDRLLCHPDQSKEVCEQVRRRTGVDVEDDQILESLLNARKRGRVK